MCEEKELSKENTDEITCPYCGYEFSDSWEYIPRDRDGEITWKQSCVDYDCDKEFDVVFDARNVDNGYTTKILECSEGNHVYKVHDKCYDRGDYDINRMSKFARIERCINCDDWKFIPVREDGSDFTKQEFLDIKVAKRLAEKPKIYHTFNGVKLGSFTIDIGMYLKLNLQLNEPEGNIHLWVEICRWFKSRGFKAVKLPDYLRRDNVEFKRGFVECTVSIRNCNIAIEFYQNEILEDRKKGDGRYEYHKYKVLTPYMKVKMRSEINAVKNKFIDKGFVFEKEKSDYNKLLEKLNVQKLEDWNDPKSSTNSYRKDRNNVIINSGDLKFYYSGKILNSGIVYWNNGHMWYVLSGGKLEYKASHELFDYNGEPKRKLLTKDQQVQKFHTLLTQAEKSRDYDRCKVLWSKIESYKLYRVWSIKHNQWWGKNNSGYTSNKELAGVYTHENITAKQNYYNDGVDSKAVLIEN